MLLLSYAHHFISEEEFVLLNDASFSKSPVFPHGNYDGFDLDAMDETECLHEFRVRKTDIPRLADAFGLPESLCCHQRTRADRRTCRYAAKCKYLD